MKLKILLLLMVLVTMLPTQIKGQDLASRQYTEDHPLIYEDAWDLWPYVYLNQRGEPEGFNIDMLKILFEELDIPYVIKLKPTSEAVEDLRTGRSDLMLRLRDTFHGSYGRYGQEVISMFTHSAVSPKSKPVEIKRLDDLKDHRVMVHWGSLSHRIMVDHGWEQNCEPIGDMKEAIQRVSSRNEGYIVWNTLSLKWLMKKFQTSNLQMTPIDMPSGEYRFWSNDSVLLERLDSAYAVLCASDRIQPILNKWFYPDRVDTGIPDWIEYLAAFIGLMVFLLLYYVINLRIRERSMTRVIAKHNRRLALILRTTDVRVWLYHIQKRKVAWLKDDGEMDNHEYSMEEFGAKYTVETFQRLNSALHQMTVGEKDNCVTELTSKDGDVACEYVCTLSVFRRSRRGEPTVLVCMMDDQTDRLMTLRKAKDSMLRYQTIFSTSMVDMTYYDADGILTEINQKACQTLNCKREEILPERLPFTDALEDPSVKLSEFEGSYTTHFIKPDGKLFRFKSADPSQIIYYEQLLIPFYGDNHRILGILGSGRDVSEFVESFHQQQRRVSQLMSAANDVTEYISNINYALHAGGVRLVNYSPVSHMLTVFREMNVVQLQLTQSRCLSLVDETSKRKAVRLLNMMDQRSTEKVSVDIKTQIRLPDGYRLSLQFEFIPIYNKEGDVDEYFGLCRDVSQLKATEEDLEREKAKAQEVENVKNVFLRNMSHELRIPLMTVVGFADMFTEEHNPADEDAFIAEIKNNSNFLLKLVNDILFLSRLDAHMVEYNRSPVDFACTFEGHCQMGWATGIKPGVRYIVDNPYEHLVVDIDDSNVGRIIEQTCENAARFTDKGYVRVRYDYIGDRLLVTIEDTGSGIDAEKQKRLFDRFSTPLGENSTGLGLPICKELAQQMGGSIYVNSAPGRGTTIWLVIPCQATQVEKKLIINQDGYEDGKS